MIPWKSRGERGGRGNKGIYIYIIYRVDPLLSAGVVSMRQHAQLLYARACISAHSQAHFHIHAHICARTHAYTSVLTQEGTDTYIHAHLCENAHAHAHDAYERACTDTHAPDTRGPYHAHTHVPTHEHACMCTHTCKHTRTCMHAHTHALRTRPHAHACMLPHNAHACIRTRTREHTRSCARTHTALYARACISAYSQAHFHIYSPLSVYAHIHIQVYSLMKAHTHTRMRICVRMRTRMHMTHTSARAQTRMYSDTRGPDNARTPSPAHEHACMCMHTQELGGGRCSLKWGFLVALCQESQCHIDPPCEISFHQSRQDKAAKVSRS